MEKHLKDTTIKTAVLFLIFNRLDTTKQVFEAIKEAKPSRLYIAGDGARVDVNGEKELVEQIREYVLKNVDWDCQVKTLFRKHNKGCGHAVKEAIDWFFQYEKKGIILEDDTLPTQDFFRYCGELLEKYKNDDRIGMISGTNHIGSSVIYDSYTFSKYKACWGWATWRRSWKNMDFEMKWLHTPYKDLIIRNMGYSKSSISHWKNSIKSIKDNSVDAWDWQWYFSLAAQGQLCIFPRTNMVANIGFGENATHTFGKAPAEYLTTSKLEFPLSHPKYILENINFDRLFEMKKIKRLRIRKLIPKSIKNKIKKWFFR